LALTNNLPLSQAISWQAQVVSKMKREHIYYNVDGTPNRKTIKENGGWRQFGYLKGKWKPTTDGLENIPYGSDRLVKDKSGKDVFIFEGEKDVERAWENSLNATTNACGAASWKDELNNYLKNRRVVIVSDNDQAGHNRNTKIQESLTKSGIENVVLTAERLELAENSDFSDWMDLNNNNIDAFLSLVAIAWAEKPGPLVDGTSKRSVHDECDRLAQLCPLEYDAQRKDSAQHYNIRTTTLDAEVRKRYLASCDYQSSEYFDDVLPWLEPIDGIELLDTVLATVKRFCVLPEHSAPIITCWIVHAWAADAADISPILAFTSPEKRCGKTIALSTVAELTPRALIASNISTSVLFRVIEKHQPTILIDEADTFLKAREEMRGMIQGGWNRATPWVWRSAGEEHEPKRFSVWAPKAIAMIGTLPDTIEDRSFVVRLRRKENGEEVQRFSVTLKPEFDPIKQKLLRWTEDNMISLRSQNPDVPDELNDRARDNSRFLCAIADVAGGHWPDTIRKSLVGLANANLDDVPVSDGVMLLRDISETLKNRQGTNIPTKDLLLELERIEDGPWAVWSSGQPISGRMLSQLLKPYNVRPQRNATQRFYSLDDLRGAVRRYVD